MTYVVAQKPFATPHASAPPNDQVARIAGRRRSRRALSSSSHAAHENPRSECQRPASRRQRTEYIDWWEPVTLLGSKVTLLGSKLWWVRREVADVAEAPGLQRRPRIRRLVRLE